ncbi:hypothetical protein DSO57_1039259 [Entomophthora muscae]|uniref:Uncharacterized protein n=1 Tax=Entomophthora muscae TaxID=34485 RepID=A0ACC2UKG2_9FUNG|nr:hypothetical protein DSO57_1039259 [Entomophthora muscae]
MLGSRILFLITLLWFSEGHPPEYNTGYFRPTTKSHQKEPENISNLATAASPHSLGNENLPKKHCSYYVGDNDPCYLIEDPSNVKPLEVLDPSVPLDYEAVPKINHPAKKYPPRLARSKSATRPSQGTSKSRSPQRYSYSRTDGSNYLSPQRNSNYRPPQHSPNIRSQGTSDDGISQSTSNSRESATYRPRWLTPLFSLFDNLSNRRSAYNSV